MRKICKTVILNDYTDDIVKYAEGAEKTKARACFLSIPKHLAKDYKKFRYSLVESKATNRKYGGSLMWLYDAGIYKGAVYENIIAEIFAKNGKKLYYFKKDSRLEMDFFIRYKKRAVAVEVKSAEKAASKSMTSII